MYGEGMVGRRWGSRGAGLLLTHRGQVLLLLRSDEVLEPGTWGIPGGAVPRRDDGLFEDNLASARRETKEEIGFAPRGRMLDSFVWREPRFQYTTFLVEVSLAVKRRRPRLNWENDDWGWFALEEAFSLPLHFGAQAALTALAARIG